MPTEYFSVGRQLGEGVHGIEHACSIALKELPASTNKDSIACEYAPVDVLSNDVALLSLLNRVFILIQRLLHRHILILLSSEVVENVALGMAGSVEAVHMHPSHLQMILVLNGVIAGGNIIFGSSKDLYIRKSMLHRLISSRMVTMLVSGEEVLTLLDSHRFKEGDGLLLL